MRVPEEIFTDVKRYMEKRKKEYLAQLDGVELPAGMGIDPDIKETIREVIREELRNLSGSSLSPSSMPPAKLTAKERILELLRSHPNEPMTTIQIQQMLNIPGPTARQSTRELSEEHDDIDKIPGRPNKYICRQ